MCVLSRVLGTKSQHPAPWEEELASETALHLAFRETALVHRVTLANIHLAFARKMASFVIFHSPLPTGAPPSRPPSCLTASISLLPSSPSWISPSWNPYSTRRVKAGEAAVSVWVHMSRFQPTCLASGSMNLAWVLDPMSLPQCVLPTVLSQSLALWSSHQAYFCSASA
ncbi:Zona Pellucida Sperm-Binding Protein 1 [Manis pentadactyla]|nr:Zona Pellucida Sperm-Binding Protein 1 [Manis pentadactyla]